MDHALIVHEFRKAENNHLMFVLASMLPEEFRGEYSDLSKATGKYIEKGI